MLTAAEDSLIEYNIENRIINYGEQTKQVASMDAAYRMMDNDLICQLLLPVRRWSISMNINRWCGQIDPYQQWVYGQTSSNVPIEHSDLNHGNHSDEKNRKKLEEQKHVK